MPSTTFLSTLSTAPLAPLDQMARSTSGTRMPSTVSRAIPTWVVASPRRRSTSREASSPMPFATTGARASNTIPRITQSRSCCILLTMMSASPDHQPRRGKARRGKKTRLAVYNNGYLHAEKGRGVGEFADRSRRWRKQLIKGQSMDG